MKIKKKIVLFVIGLLGFVSYAGADCPQDRVTPKAPDEIYNLSIPDESTENFIAGRILYKEAKPVACSVCHGGEGKGDGKISKAFKTPNEVRNFKCKESMKDVTNGQMFWVIKNGSEGTGMTPYTELSDDEIWQLVYYVRAKFAR